MDPLGSWKNPSPTWDLNPQPSVIHSDALTAERIDSVTSKCEMWVFDLSCITQLQSQVTLTDSIAHNCMAQSPLSISEMKPTHHQTSNKQPTNHQMSFFAHISPLFVTGSIRSAVRASEWITEGRGFKSHLGLGFFRLPSGLRQKYISYINNAN